MHLQHLNFVAESQNIDAKNCRDIWSLSAFKQLGLGHLILTPMDSYPPFTWSRKESGNVFSNASGSTQLSARILHAWTSVSAADSFSCNSFDNFIILNYSFLLHYFTRCLVFFSMRRLLYKMQPGKWSKILHSHNIKARKHKQSLWRMQNNENGNSIENLLQFKMPRKCSKASFFVCFRINKLCRYT